MRLKNFFLSIPVFTYFVFQTAARLCLSLYSIYFGKTSAGSLPEIFLTGMLSDCVFLFYSFPFLGFFSILFYKISFQNKFFLKLFALSGYFFLLAILSFGLLSEIVFWDEFETRFNFIAVDYLIYTNEIIGTLKESMPLREIGFGYIFFLTLVLFSARGKIYSGLKNFSPEDRFLRSAVCAILALCSFYFYDSEKFNLGRDRYSVELGKNGPYEFFSAFYGNKLDYSKLYPTISKEKALQKVRALVAPEGTEFRGSGLGRFVKTPGEAKKFNLVLIVVESLSSEFIGKLGNRDGITPYLDKISGESLFFTNFYATGTRTVRGLEAVTLSIPPIPGTSALRMEGSAGAFNIGSVLEKEGYSVDFMYGGFSYFDNLKGYFSSNRYKVTDRSDFKKEEIEFSNIWGVSDGDLFNKSLNMMDERASSGKPFFYLITTTSNHRPYTFPEGKIDLPSGSGRKAAVKYTDYVIGKFIEDAKKKEWFENTIFVIVADHCASSSGKTDLPIEKYQIPLIIYAPKIVKPKKIDSLASQIDIAPTVFSLMGFNYYSKFFGKDIIKDNPNRAFISTYQSLGYIKDGYLVILKPRAKPKTYKLKGKEKEERENIDSLTEEAISFYQTSYDLFSSGAIKDNEK